MRVRWSVVGNMIAAGRLQPGDLVWKPGMALWVPASQVRGMPEGPCPTTSREPRFHNRSGLRAPPGVQSAAVTAMVLIGLVAAKLPMGEIRLAESGAEAALVAKNLHDEAVGNRNLKKDAPQLHSRPGQAHADLDDLLAKPGKFAGNEVALNGLFKIGTKLSEVRGPDRQVLGWSLPVAGNDDSIVCSMDGKITRQNAYLLLDDRLAACLNRVFDKLRLRRTIKPSYKSILTVTSRRLLVNGAPAPVVVISSMEVLGGCNYLSVARHQYSKAFRTLAVSPDVADVDFGDGDLWVERLGGEANFVQPIRRKFHEMQRRAVTNRDSVVIDTILRRQLANVVSPSNAVTHIAALQGLNRRRIWP
jgi:uncharacterized protein DUF4339